MNASDTNGWYVRHTPVSNLQAHAIRPYPLIFAPLFGGVTFSARAPVVMGTYAAADQLTSLAAWLGHTTGFAYDQDDRLTGFNAGLYSYGYDGDGLQATESLSGSVEAFNWDAAEGLPPPRDAGTRYATEPDGTPVESIGVTGMATY